MIKDDGYRACGEKIGEFTPGVWGNATVYALSAGERLADIIENVLDDHGKTKLVSSSPNAAGNSGWELYAYPPFKDSEEARAVGEEIQDLWEEALEEKYGAVCTEQAGTFQPGQVSSLQQTINAIKNQNPNCALPATAS